MPPEDDTKNAAPEAEKPEAAPEKPEAEKPEAARAEAPAGDDEGKVLQIPTKAMKGIKDTERERGRTLAMQELNDRAKALGFDSWEALEKAAAASKAAADKAAAEQAAAEKAKAATPPEPPVEAKPASEAAPSDKPAKPKSRELRKELRQANAEKRKLAAEQAAEREKREALEHQMTVLQAEHGLRLAAVASGVTDVDYALHVLRSTLEGKSDAELEAFDEAAFFKTTLRDSHPFLYGVESRPANTSAVADPPAAPKSGASASAPANETDARKLSREEFDKRLRSLGLSPPLIGMVSH